MNSKKSILFLSGIDFKEKSIQVIRKTPEAYRDAGWDVTYIVARDNSVTGNYFYENEINPNNMDIIRFYWGFLTLRSFHNRYISLFFSKLASMFVIFKLFYYALTIIKKKKIDVIYGYELQGILALRLLSLFVDSKVVKVKRFQGSFLYEILSNKQKMRLLFNSDAYYAMKVNADITIMTNDGTQGDKAYGLICKNKKEIFKFYVNGVDKFQFSHTRLQIIKEQYELNDKVVFLSVSRLVHWKHVERNIEIVKKIVDKGFLNFKYIIIGDGDQYDELVTLVKYYNLESYIVFIGSLKQQEVNNYLAVADFFFSMYDSSNVGNPLLEAIRANKFIITLNNGDTSQWIQHGYNGFIYNLNEDFIEQAATDIIGILKDINNYNRIISNIKKTEDEKLWTWKQRLDTEIKSIECILYK